MYCRLTVCFEVDVHSLPVFLRRFLLLFFQESTFCFLLGVLPGDELEDPADAENEAEDPAIDDPAVAILQANVGTNDVIKMDNYDWSFEGWPNFGVYLIVQNPWGQHHDAHCACA